MTIAHSETEDRVRRHTAADVNWKIDREIADRIRLYSQVDRDAITRRMEELDREWDMERVLETNAASFALTGTILGAFVNRKWLALPMIVTGFLLQHAVQGWCPPVPLLRRLGVRTRREIERERYALKVLRGDFDKIIAEENGDVEQLIATVED